MSKELTKTVNQKCQDCGKQLNILCNEGCQIVSVRCSDCFQTFRVNAIDIEKLQAYLSKKGWIEIPIERVTAIKMRAPHPQISVFMPAKKDLVDYTRAMEITLNTIAMYYEKTIDDVLSEVLEKER